MSFFEIILDPSFLSISIFVVSVTHFFFFLIPFLKRRLSKKYTYYFNIILCFVLLLLTVLYLPIGIYEYVPDDPSTPYIYSGSARGIFTFYSYSYGAENFSLSYVTEFHLIPLILNFLGVVTPLILINLIPPVRTFVQKNFQRQGLSVMLSIFAIIFSFFMLWGTMMNVGISFV